MCLQNYNAVSKLKFKILYNNVSVFFELSTYNVQSHYDLLIEVKSIQRDALSVLLQNISLFGLYIYINMMNSNVRSTHSFLFKSRYKRLAVYVN